MLYGVLHSWLNSSDFAKLITIVFTQASWQVYSRLNDFLSVSHVEIPLELIKNVSNMSHDRRDSVSWC